MSVIKHSVTEGIWRYINVYILGSVRNAVMCAVRHSVAKVFSRDICPVLISSHIPMLWISYSLWCIIWGIITIYRSCDLYFCGIFKKFSFVHWYNFTLGKKACMSGSSRIFCKLIVFMYCSCLEMMDIVVYEYLLKSHHFPHVETVFVGHMFINYPLLECGNWIHNCICAGHHFIIYSIPIIIFCTLYAEWETEWSTSSCVCEVFEN
jgi:hypothetical protein